MPLLEIVTHCWRYSRVLEYQLESLCAHWPRYWHVHLSTFYTPGDEQTALLLGCVKYRTTLERHASSHGQRLPAFSARPLPPNLLLRRAVGRSIAARSTQADVVWFADCDYWFGEGCIDAIPWPLPADLCYPRQYFQQKTRELGDEYAMKRRTAAGSLRIDPADFEPRRQKFALGGLQIASGEAVRRLGYADTPRHQRPLKNPTAFDFRSDVAFRRQFARSQGIDLPNLYRIRQVQTGRVDTLALDPQGATDAQL